MKTINVCGIIYRLVFLKNLEDKNESVWGFVDYENTIIYIRENMSKQKRHQTIIHESLHAMLHEAGLDDFANDEKLVTPLGNTLCEFLKDNAKIIQDINRLGKNYG